MTKGLTGIGRVTVFCSAGRHIAGHSRCNALATTCWHGGVCLLTFRLCCTDATSTGIALPVLALLFACHGASLVLLTLLDIPDTVLSYSVLATQCACTSWKACLVHTTIALSADTLFKQTCGVTYVPRSWPGRPATLR